jgi:M6 family metalloprotease-like protein
VEIKPVNAKIEILNLSPKKKFRQGMELEDGKYLIKISSTGYNTIERWISHSSSKKSPHYFTLDKSPKIDRADEKAASTVVNTGEDTISRKGLLKGRMVSNGNIKGLTILVEFADLTTDISADEIETLLNSENTTPNGNYSSVREYFKIISSGKLDYTNKVVGPIKLSHKRDFYKNNSLVNEAIDIVIQDLGVDLSEFDSRGEGIVDAMTFLYAGPTVFDGQLWPHNFQLNKSYGNIKTNYYFITSLGNSPLNLPIGGLCRSAAVMLCRFPSLAYYRKKDGQYEKNQAIGAYGLMGIGYSLNAGRTPAPVNPYLRLLAGWIDNVILINDPGKFEAVHGRYDTVVKHETNKPNEFFLIENRSRLDLDYYLPSSGLAIYHCDTNAPMGDQAANGGKRSGIVLIRADGNTALPNSQNQDDSGDLFGQVKGKAISFSTKPSSRMWDGSDSGFIVSNISAPGDVISFQIDQPRISIIRDEAIENMTIPGDDPGGISSKINISKEGKVKSIKIIIDIIHTYIGDLHLALMSPSGKIVILHDRTGGSQDNLIKMYSSDKFEALQAMRMESIQGDWILQVSDKTQMDTGQLKSWKLIIEYE